MPVTVDSLPLDAAAIEGYLKDLSLSWSIDNQSIIKKNFAFSSFNAALKFLEEVAELAKLENHHPAMLIDYKKVTIFITSHRVKGLTENDFILAAKIDAIFLTFHEKS